MKQTECDTCDRVDREYHQRVVETMSQEIDKYALVVEENSKLKQLVTLQKKRITDLENACKSKTRDNKRLENKVKCLTDAVHHLTEVWP